MTALVTFGESMLRLSPPAGDRLELATSLDLRVAGAESNVAIAAQRLGAEATWLSKLPDSPLGRRVATWIRQHDVQTAIAWSDAGRQGTYYIEQGGAPRGTNVLYDRENAAIRTGTPDELAVEAIRDAELFYTSGITPALSSTLAETTETLLTEAADGGTTTALDVNYRSKLWSPAAARETLEGLFPALDVLVVAERDARTVLERAGDPDEIASGLADAWDFETVVLTRGANGALAWHDGSRHDQPAVEADTLDPVGSGDAFTGAFLAMRLAGESVPSALEYGAAAAALKRTLAGDDAVLTRAEVERVIDAADEGVSR